MDILTILIPMFLMLGAGTLYRWVGWRMDADAFTDLIMNLFMPCLVFSALLRTEVGAGQLGLLTLANLLLVASLFLLAWLVSRFLNRVPGSYYLPILFMNAGFLGIPLLNLYGGEPAMASVIIFDQVQSLLIFTLGLGLVTARFPFREQLGMFVREPIVWAIVAGLILPLIPWRPTGWLRVVLDSGLEGLSLLGEATIPMALFLVGYVLHKLRPSLDGAVVSACVLRLVVSPLIAVVLCFLLGLTGPDGAAVLLAAALPSAVFSYVLAQRYDEDPGYAAGVVFYTSVAVLVTLPAVLMLAYDWFPPPF